MTNEDSQGRTLIVRRVFAHPPEKVWRALTEGALLREWLMDNDFQLVVGHRFNFRADPQPHWNGVVDCEVLEVVPHERLSYTWNASGAEADTGPKTVVTWTLAPRDDGGVLLEMEQTGFREDQEANYQGAKYGWARNLETLEVVLGGTT